jgi:very-short-patch-repair endonuclease
MRRDIDEAVVRLAVPQRGCFSRAQALSCGASRDLIKRRVRSGQWSREEVGVYGLAGGADDHLRRLWVAHLAVGPRSVVSHEAAGADDELEGVPLGSLVFTVPHSGYHRIAGVSVHQISDLTTESCETRHGLPFTSTARTLVDLAAVARLGRLAAALDDAVMTKRLTTLGAVGRELARVARRGKPHLGRLVVLLDERGPGKEPSQSVLEQALFRLLATAGLPEPQRQFPFPGRVISNGHVDAAYPEAKLILEADGRRWHTRVRDLARDHERDGEAARAGWATLRLLYEQIVDEPEWTASLVADTLATRLAQLTATSTH